MARRHQRSKGMGTLIRRGGRGPWIARWFDHDGRRKERSTGTTDRAAAERILAKRVADAALRRDGVVDARADRYIEAEHLPLAQHVNDWTASLRARNRTAPYVGQQAFRARGLFARMHAERLSAITLSRVQAAMTELRADRLTWRTLNYYAQAVGQFLRWCRRDRRIRENPLDGLTRAQTATDRRYERRALDAEELRLLVDAAERGPVSEELTGPDRAILCQVAAGTGFRVSELHSLTPASFRLDDDPPVIALRAASSKRRQDDVQPIRPDLAELLRVWLDDRLADAPLWPGQWHKHGARMIRADLRRAKARWIKATCDPRERRERRDSEFLAERDGAGRVVDFHALRATYITLLVRSGASVKVVQELARHSDPKLTLNVYSKLGVHDLSGALDGLPSLAPTAPQRERLRATGTCDDKRTAMSEHRLYPRQLGRETVRDGATSCDKTRARACAVDARNPLSATKQCEVVRADATKCDDAPGRTRTCDRRIRNPLLCPPELRALRSSVRNLGFYNVARGAEMGRVVVRPRGLKPAALRLARSRSLDTQRNPTAGTEAGGPLYAGSRGLKDADGFCPVLRSGPLRRSG